MNSSQLFEPTLGAYFGYCIGFWLRYFAIAGFLYWFFHVAFSHRWLRYRIQPHFPPGAQVAHEIFWSISNTFCTGLSTLLLYRLVRDGRTSMYFDAGAHGWGYFVLSIAAGIIAYDSWFYWQHRLLHTQWLFAKVHAVHHRATNPTAFGAFAHHPLETFMGNAFFLVLAVVLPMHPLAFGAVGVYLFAAAIISHLGYEFYPRGFTRHRLGRWWDTSTHHNMHHRHASCNYSILFNYWDLWMGTNHGAYHQTFDIIKARLGAGDVAASARGVAGEISS